MIRKLLIGTPMDVAEAAAWVTADELAAAAAFSPKRRSEYLSWRALVRRELGLDAQIAYNEVGAPIITNYPLYISVSHCPERIAVVMSDRRCAVDVEPLGRDFSRVASRCMSEDEQNLSDDPLLPAALWCAKEALYKYAGEVELDLLRDLHIERVDLRNGRNMVGRIKNGEPVKLSVSLDDGFVIVYIL